MFKGIQSIIQNPKGNKNKGLAALQEIKSAEDLLDTKKRKAITHSLQLLLGLEKKEFPELASSLLNNFVEFVQQLPETRSSYYSKPGGFIDHSLERTHVAIKLIRAYFFPGVAVSKAERPTNEAQKLWLYTAFSASILKDIGRLIVDLDIQLYDQHANFLQHWSPFTGSMLNGASHYKYEFIDSSHTDPFRRRTTFLLARQLMPEEGFNWICSDRDVLAIWLALLDDDARDAGTLGPMLQLADAQVIHDFFAHENFIEKGARGAKFMRGPFSASPADATTDSNDMIIAASFLNWLRNQMSGMQIAKDRLLIGDFPLFIVTEGLLIPSELFRQFASQHTQFKSGQAVQNAFLKHGFHLKGEGSSAQHSYMNIKTKEEVSGLVLTNINLAVPASLTAEIASKSPALLVNYAKVPAAMILKVAAVNAISREGALPVREGQQDTNAPGKAKVGPIGHA